MLVMTVEPGFGGQEFIPSSLDKISRLKRMLMGGLDRVPIAVDGEIRARTAGSVVRAGASVLVVGSGIFNAKSPVAENFREPRAAIAMSDLPENEEDTNGGEEHNVALP